MVFQMNSLVALQTFTMAKLRTATNWYFWKYRGQLPGFPPLVAGLPKHIYEMWCLPLSKM